MEAVIEYLPGSRPEIKKFPFTSVELPMAVPVTYTFTPTRVSPEAASVTTPMILPPTFGALAATRRTQENNIAIVIRRRISIPNEGERNPPGEVIVLPVKCIGLKKLLKVSLFVKRVYLPLYV
jgi:hypothetical protein